MNQLAGVNIQSSVGMFTVSFQSLIYAEPFGFLCLLRNFLLDYLYSVSQNKTPAQFGCDNCDTYQLISYRSSA